MSELYSKPLKEINEVITIFDFDYDLNFFGKAYSDAKNN
jgi:hypothetical protein